MWARLGIHLVFLRSEFCSHMPITNDVFLGSNPTSIFVNFCDDKNLASDDFALRLYLVPYPRLGIRVDMFGTL